jgi:hypothetical protein
MSVKRDVAVRTTALLVPILLFALPASSQDQREWQRALGSPERSQQSTTTPRAPVGHRQPTVADLPKDLPSDPDAAEREKRDRELDAKLRICRNC